MTYISSALVTSLKRIAENAGRLCFDNIVTSQNISATSELSPFPATNMANEATAFGWEAADASTQTITISNPVASPVDYIGLARHNLNQPGLTITVKFNGAIVLGPAAVTQSQAQLLLFENARPSLIEIVIAGAGEPPKIAVVYAGQSLKLERNIYVGHTPITYGRERNIINGVSQSGEWLGSIVLNEVKKTSVSLSNLTPQWYRNNLDRFFAMSPRKPCFWAWRPGTYPAEVGYCWVDGNPQPVNQRANGMMEISWNFTGVGEQ